MDGVEDREGVAVVAATSRPELLDRSCPFETWPSRQGAVLSTARRGIAFFKHLIPYFLVSFERIILLPLNDLQSKRLFNRLSNTLRMLLLTAQ